jgi:hypothetical protein
MDASPTAADARPTITRREVSWNGVVAAIRARREAEARGIDPDAKAAVVAAAMTRPALPPITLGTLWALEETEPLLGELVGSSEWADQSLLSLTLLDPERVLSAALVRDLDGLRVGILETSTAVTPERARALDQHFTAEMLRLKKLAGGSAEENAPKK